MARLLALAATVKLRLIEAREGRMPRRVGAFAVSAVLAVGLLGLASVPTWNGVSPDRIRAELAEFGILTQSNMKGTAARAVKNLNDERLASVGPLLAGLGDVWALDLSQTQIASLEPVKRLTTL